jgi:hypothetical protein
MKLTKKDIESLEAILYYLGDEEFKHFADMVDEEDHEDREHYYEDGKFFRPPMA